MDDNDKRPEAVEPSTGDPWSAYLPIGLVFFILWLVFFLNEDMRSISWAFLPIGLTFFIIGLTRPGAPGKDDDDKDGEEDGEDGRPSSRDAGPQ